MDFQIDHKQKISCLLKVLHFLIGHHVNLGNQEFLNLLLSVNLISPLIRQHGCAMMRSFLNERSLNVQSSLFISLIIFY